MSRRNNNQGTFRDMRSLVDTAVHDAQTSFGQLLYQTKMPKVQSNKVINPGFKGQSRQATVNATLNPTSSRSSLCKCCNLSHRLWKCEKCIGYSYADSLEFVRKEGLCFNCLVYRHHARDCQLNLRCKTCKSKHHSLLHYDKTKFTRDQTHSVSESLLKFILMKVFQCAVQAYLLMVVSDCTRLFQLRYGIPTQTNVLLHGPLWMKDPK